MTCAKRAALRKVEMLRRSTERTGGKPDLILLDLNMPGMGGKEFLKQVKADETLRQIPVVIVTTSSSERDIVDGYALQAAGYVLKPATLDELKEVMTDIQDYWFLLCRLPRKEHSPL
jgi:CheY-like chemotaxis protein